MPQAPAPRAPIPQPTVSRAPAVRPPATSRPPYPNKFGTPNARRGGPRSRGAARRANGPGAPPGAATGAKAEHDILFQQYFKSVNPDRTYAAQVKRAGNGNHYLVLTEGKRDDATNEVRKTRLFLYSEDFIEFFKMLQATAQFIRANPVPDEVKKKRDRLWAKKAQVPRPAAKARPDAAPLPAQGARLGHELGHAPR